VNLVFSWKSLNGRTKRRRIGFGGLLIDEKNVAIVKWVLTMQKMGLPITLQQLKLKMVEFTQTRPIPFHNGIPRVSWWYWFKHDHLELNIK